MVELDPLDPRCARAVAEPVDEHLDFVRQALELGLDRPVRAVSHPSADAELLGASASALAEPHALDAAVDDDATADDRLHRAEYRRSWHRRRVDGFVDDLARARIGATYNQYAHAPHLRERLSRYLRAREDAPVLLVGEAAGYRGARISGLPFTSERQVTGSGPAEATATIVHRVLAQLAVENTVLLWNVVPTHPHEPNRPYTNRRPARDEVEASARFLEGVALGRLVIAVGRLAEHATGAPYVRHPSHGGAEGFHQGLARLL